MLCVQPLVPAQTAGSVLGGVGLAKGGHSKGEQTGALTAEFGHPALQAVLVGEWRVCVGMK